MTQRCCRPNPFPKHRAAAEPRRAAGGGRGRARRASAAAAGARKRRPRRRKPAEQATCRGPGRGGRRAHRRRRRDEAGQEVRRGRPGGRRGRAGRGRRRPRPRAPRRRARAAQCAAARADPLCRRHFGPVRCRRGQPGSAAAQARAAAGGRFAQAAQGAGPGRPGLAPRDGAADPAGPHLGQQRAGPHRPAHPVRRPGQDQRQADPLPHRAAAGARDRLPQAGRRSRHARRSAEPPDGVPQAAAPAAGQVAVGRAGST